MPKTSLDFLIYKGLQHRSFDALTCLHRRGQSALTGFLLCCFIKHHFRNHDETITKNPNVFSGKTHTDIKGKMNYFKHYTSANILHILSVKDHSSRDLVRQCPLKQRAQIATSLTRKADLHNAYWYLGFCFFGCFCLFSICGTFLNQVDCIQTENLLKLSNRNSFSTFTPFELLVNFLCYRKC